MANTETYVLGLTNRTTNAIITNIAKGQARNLANASQEQDWED